MIPPIDCAILPLATEQRPGGDRRHIRIESHRTLDVHCSYNYLTFKHKAA